MSKKTKKTLITILVIYLGLGIITALVYALSGSYISNGDKRTVEYDFKDEPMETVSQDILSQEPDLTVTATEPVEETEPEEETVSEDTVPEIHYYRFKVKTTDTWLNIRQNADMDSKVVSHLNNGQEGYILEKGEEWSLIIKGKKTGYARNDYLEITEIPEEEYPEEYR